MSNVEIPNPKNPNSKIQISKRGNWKSAKKAALRGGAADLFLLNFLLPTLLFIAGIPRCLLRG